MKTFLDKILSSKLLRINERKQLVDSGLLRQEALKKRSFADDFAFSKALASRERLNVIAEIKRASPSKGIINSDIDVADQARSYESGGAAAISVLTEEDYFRGSIEDLMIARESVMIPVLRKDFIVDALQIYEAAAAGADAVLLIVAALEEGDLRRLRTVAREELKMDVLVEVHTTGEMEIATKIGADLIGVNNRNLNTFEVSLDVSRDLVKHKPEETLMVAESGISSPEEIDELHDLGFDGFLIGEALMRSREAGNLLTNLTRRGAKV